MSFISSYLKALKIEKRH